MNNGLISLYLPSYINTIVYMLQSTEYQIGPYLKWYWRTQNFSKVMNRRTLETTRAARLLKLGITVGVLLQILGGVALFILGATNHITGGVAFGAALILAYPITWAHLVVVPLLLGRYFIVLPKEQQQIVASSKIFADHPGVRIAVAGSYGKTSMKELLLTVLAMGKKVAATPANKNVAVSHAAFARKLDGDEDILIIEYGEGAPGDVVRFAETTNPTHAVITGIAPAHLDKYKTLAAAAQDIFSLKDSVPHSQLYVNAESPAAKDYIQADFKPYDSSGVNGWKVSNVSVELTGTSFVIKKGTKSLKLHSGLVGRHQVGPLTLAASLGLIFGLTTKQVTDGVAATKPFEHRMRPYALGGGWIVDDTYNGNIEGVRVGTALLKELKATRKWYVTPGLVEQGKDNKKIHEEFGGLIASANPDIVVLMKNSVTQSIQKGLDAAGYKGEVRIEKEPLKFYTNLDQFIATGDVIMMQNDWTDNYA
jgi:UDP-N-acetylmuramyl pentapeptide synthase